MAGSSVLALCFAVLVAAHGDHHDGQTPIAGPLQSLWYNRLPGDGGTQADSVFSGISTFGRLPYLPCLSSKDINYDIAFIGSSSVKWELGACANCQARCSIRYRHIIQAWCPIWAIWYSPGIPPSQPLVSYIVCATISESQLLTYL